MRVREFLKPRKEDLGLQKEWTQAWVRYEAATNPSMQKKALTALHEIITKADVGSLLRLALNDPGLNECCQLPCFKAFWDEAWRLCGANPREQAEKNHLPVQEYSPIATVSSFDLVKGFFIYQGYLKAIENQEINTSLIELAEEYLSRAAACGCFFAINALCREGLRLLPSLEDDKEAQRLLANKILTYAHKAADLYWTPGYILLSNVLHGLARYVTLLFPDGDPVISRTQFFMEALTAVCVAQKLEKYSAPMIQDAYQGKTVFEASQQRLSSWPQAKFRLVALSRSLLQTRDLETAEGQALRIFNGLYRSHHLAEMKKEENEDKMDLRELKASSLSSPRFQ